jgi:predicted nucleic acid-binding protein
VRKVVDASAIASICFAEPEGPAIAAAFAGAELVAPTLLDYELANVAWKKLRRNPAERELILAGLRMRGRLSIATLPVIGPDVVTLALATGLTAYDASYLWLARQLNAPLVTLDRRLEQVASGA